MGIIPDTAVSVEIGRNKKRGRPPKTKNALARQNDDNEKSTDSDSSSESEQADEVLNLGPSKIFRHDENQVVEKEAHQEEIFPEAMKNVQVLDIVGDRPSKVKKGKKKIEQRKYGSNQEIKSCKQISLFLHLFFLQETMIFFIFCY